VADVATAPGLAPGDADAAAVAALDNSAPHIAAAVTALDTWAGNRRMNSPTYFRIGGSQMHLEFPNTTEVS
jgi:hypothetical protein